MAACGSLRHIFDSTITENNSSSSSASSLIDSLTSWKQVKPLNPPLDHSLTEIFGELHFKEHHHPPAPTPTSSFFTPPLSSPSSSLLSSLLVSHSPANVDGYKDDEKGGGIKASISDNNDGYSKSYLRKSNSFSFLNSDSLQLCTEGLGSESLGDVVDLKTDSINNRCSSNNIGEDKEKVHVRRHVGDTYSYCRNKRANGKTVFPPPISYIGQSGKPAVSFQSYRKDGRFVLKEVRIPTQECLQASREDGRLRLSFVQSNDDDDDDDYGDDDENGGEDDGHEEEQGKYEEVEDETGVRDV